MPIMAFYYFIGFILQLNLKRFTGIFSALYAILSIYAYGTKNGPVEGERMSRERGNRWDSPGSKTKATLRSEESESRSRVGKSLKSKSRLRVATVRKLLESRRVGEISLLDIVRTIVGVALYIGSDHMLLLIDIAKVVLHQEYT